MRYFKSIQILMAMVLTSIFSSWSWAQAQATTKPAIQTKSTVAKPAAVKQKPVRNATAKPVVEPIQSDGVIRVQNQKETKPAFTPKAEDVSNKVPPAFVEQMLNENLWLDEVERAGTPANLEMQSLISAFTSGMASNSIADLVIRDLNTDSRDKKTKMHKLKISLIRYLENANPVILNSYKLNRNRLAEIKSMIAQKYLGAIFTLIQGSEVRDYHPILEELRQLLRSGTLKVIDLSPDVRRDWNSEKAKIKIHQYENFGLEEKKDGEYLVTGLYVDGKKTFAFDLLRSKEENLVTIAHEIVHAADPELIRRKEKLRELYAVVVEKLKHHLPQANIEQLVSALIQDTFFEMGRLDFVESMQKLRDERVQRLKQSLEKQPLENLVKDETFRDFTRVLIAITVENEYKAYTLSYALYQNLKTNGIIPPILSRNKFMQAQFSHSHSLPFTLSVAMNPFAKNSFLGMIQNQTSPELTNTVNQIKSIFEINYLEQSKVMMAEVGEKYAPLFDLIKRKNEMESDDSVPAWTRAGNFDSPTNPFQILEAKVSTAWAIRFKLNLQAFLKRMVGLQETLLGLRAGFMDIHNVSFGELKLLGMQPEFFFSATDNGQSPQAIPNTGQYLPPQLDSRCREDILTQIQNQAQDSAQEEFISYFAELRWRPQVQEGVSHIDQSTVMLNLYRLHLLKAVRWLRADMPQAQENILGIKTMQNKLYTGQYDTSEITTERARQMIEELGTYLEAASVSIDELKKIETLMTAVSQMYYMALESKWQPVSEEFYKRIMNARRFFENMGYRSNVAFADIEKQMKHDVQAFRDQVRKEYAVCANTMMDYYNWNKNFQLGRFSFPLTGICYEKRIYILRQTCDYNRSASTRVRNGRPESKMFIGGRYIRLEPFDSFGN